MCVTFLCVAVLLESIMLGCTKTYVIHRPIIKYCNRTIFYIRLYLKLITDRHELNCANSLVVLRCRWEAILQIDQAIEFFIKVIYNSFWHYHFSLWKCAILLRRYDQLCLRFELLCFVTKNWHLNGWTPASYRMWRQWVKRQKLPKLFFNTLDAAADNFGGAM
jgi:hypothetical protein